MSNRFCGHVGIFEDGNGKFHFRPVTDDNRVIGDGCKDSAAAGKAWQDLVAFAYENPPFVRLARESAVPERVGGSKSVDKLTYVGNPGRVETYKGTDGKFHFHAIAANGDTIGDGYRTAADAEQGWNDMRALCELNPPVVDVKGADVAPAKVTATSKAGGKAGSILLGDNEARYPDNGEYSEKVPPASMPGEKDYVDPNRRS